MFKLIGLVLIVAVIFGVLSYQNDKIVIDTIKGKEVINKGTEFIKEKVEVK